MSKGPSEEPCASAGAMTAAAAASTHATPSASLTQGPGGGRRIGHGRGGHPSRYRLAIETRDHDRHRFELDQTGNGAVIAVRSRRSCEWSEVIATPRSWMLESWFLILKIGGATQWARWQTPLTGYGGCVAGPKGFERAQQADGGQMRMKRYVMVLAAVALPISTVALLEGTAVAKTALGSGGCDMQRGRKRQLQPASDTRRNLGEQRGRDGQPDAPATAREEPRRRPRGRLAAKALKIKATKSGKSKIAGSCASFGS